MHYWYLLCSITSFVEANLDIILQWLSVLMYFGHYHRDVFVSKIFDHGKIWPSSMLVNALSLEFHWMRRLASRLHHRPGCEQ